MPGSPHWGSMALTAFDGRAVALPGWTKAEELAAFVAKPSPPAPLPSTGEGSSKAATEATSKPGETINAALGIPFTLAPGESHSATFAITWHFPNVQRFQHAGNLYSRRWPDATAVAGYLAKNLDALWQRTQLYHATLYESNLPEEFLDAMSSQSVILRGPTCFWSEDGYFGGFEGSYGCCPLNCTHVWNYAQAHARLFPDVGRNMRISNFITYLHANGETSHREHGLHPAFIDGHCACIEAAYREYQLSPDRRFLEKIWPGVKKSVDWLIKTIDRQGEGVPHGHQANTYDTSVSGRQHVHRLAVSCRPGRRRADGLGDERSGKRPPLADRSPRGHEEPGPEALERRVLHPDSRAAPARDYDTGCHADQLLGQWWAHMLDLGYLYPADRVKRRPGGDHEAQLPREVRRLQAGAAALHSRTTKAGLIICTWPRGGRPKEFILYADEVWTGIEYAAAGAMIYEGLIEQARKIVRTARSRYDGRRRDGLNSGPGGNPYNELECGKFYARAMSSWSLLIASQGLVLEGPKGLLGFKPHWQPEDHRSLFTAPEGWGLFVQQRKDKEQTERIEVRHGRLRVKELVFALPQGRRRHGDREARRPAGRRRARTSGHRGPACVGARGRRRGGLGDRDRLALGGVRRCRDLGTDDSSSQCHRLAVCRFSRRLPSRPRWACPSGAKV